MTIDLKDFVKANVVVTKDNDIQVNLKNIHAGDWELARKSEYKQDVYMIDGENFYFEVVRSRSGNYHSGYTYGKPKFSFVERFSDKEISYPVDASLKEKALELQNKYFDKNDDTELTPVYESGWVFNCSSKF